MTTSTTPIPFSPMKQKPAPVGKLNPLGWATGRKSRVVCQCECGNYTIRSLKFLQMADYSENYNFLNAQCDECVAATIKESKEKS